VRLDVRAIRERCARDGRSLEQLLRDAGVSRNAYYSLARKASLLPRSIGAIAAALGTTESELVVEPPDPAARTRERLAVLEGILARHPHVGRENAWHTLILLDRSPIERLKRGLLRANARHLHR